NALGVTATTAPPLLLAELFGGRDPVRRLETMQSLDIAGASLPSQLAQEARFYLTPNIWIGYGTSEAGRIALANAAVCVTTPGAAGYLASWAECQIVDTADRPVAVGQEGLVRIRSDEITGYYGNEAATKRNFRAGWFYPGDIGALSADN